MLKTKLFIGFQLTPSLQTYLSYADPVLLQTFFTEKYLITLSHKNQSYYGNFIGERVQSDQIKSNELFLHSLMKKLIPELNLEEIPLLLIAVPNDD